MSPIPYIVAISVALAAVATGGAAAAVDHSSGASAATQFVLSHNVARRELRVPPLAWNATLQSDARAYARARRGGCDVYHHPPSNVEYGWNLFITAGTGTLRGAGAAEEAVESWVGERQWYDSRAGACVPGHTCSGYKQVVWNTTTQLGCAVAACQSGGALVICEYYPPGNYVGERPY